MKKQQNEAKAAPVSDRRRAANRANAAHSTGPKTQTGKAASSRNAVSHGLTAAELTIFNWESPEKYAALRSDYYTRFAPIDTAESDVIDRLIDSTWRRRRALVIETTLFDLEISDTRDATEHKYGDTACGPLHLAMAFKNRHGEGVWDAILRLINSVDGAYSRALRDLQKLQGERFNVLPPSCVEQGAEPEPEPEPEPIVNEEEMNPPLQQNQNKIIEITKQTQPKSATPAPVVPQIVPPATEICKNEPIAIHHGKDESPSPSCES